VSAQRDKSSGCETAKWFDQVMKEMPHDRCCDFPFDLKGRVVLVERLPRDRVLEYVSEERNS
jgi:hypothetical protein